MMYIYQTGFFFKFCDILQSWCWGFDVGNFYQPSWNCCAIFLYISTSTILPSLCLCITTLKFKSVYFSVKTANSDIRCYRQHQVSQVNYLPSLSYCVMICVMIKNGCPVTYLSGIQNLNKYFKLINLRSIKVYRVREFNFYREEDDEVDEESLVCIYISPHGIYLKSRG